MMNEEAGARNMGCGAVSRIHEGCERGRRGQGGRKGKGKGAGGPSHPHIPVGRQRGKRKGWFLGDVLRDNIHVIVANEQHAANQHSGYWARRPSIHSVVGR